MATPRASILNPMLRRTALRPPRLPNPRHTSTTPPPPRRPSTSLSPSLPWSSLTPAQKAVRTTQQSASLLLILLGGTLTVGVAYVLYAEILSPSSKTAVFNQAADRIRNDAACAALLGVDPASSERKTLVEKVRTYLAGGTTAIVAHGEYSHSAWARNSHVHSETWTDRRGRENMKMRFHVAGPGNRGVVWVHMVREAGTWEYVSLALDVEGGERHWVQRAESGGGGGQKGLRMFGVNWS